MDSEYQERLFLAGQDSPGGWLIQGLNLRAAATRLDWTIVPTRDDEPISFIKEYHMLLGLAFENLLKGFISLVRLEAGESPSLPRECYVHTLYELATRPECAGLALSESEIETLDHLSPYIVWAGRYPIPRKAKELIGFGSSSRDREIEHKLWERLVPLLHDRAWVMKGVPESMGGYKLYTKHRE
jgi:hypothetical protein